MVLMIALSIHYVALVHGRQWYSHPDPPIAIAVLNKSVVSDLETKLKALDDGAASPEGWLRDIPAAKRLTKELKNRPFRYEVHPTWHSWYTRLFRLQRIEQDVWFGGGRLSSAHSLVLKDRTLP